MKPCTKLSFLTENNFCSIGWNLVKPSICTQPSWGLCHGAKNVPISLTVYWRCYRFLNKEMLNLCKLQKEIIVLIRFLCFLHYLPILFKFNKKKYKDLVLVLLKNFISSLSIQHSTVHLIHFQKLDQFWFSSISSYYKHITSKNPSNISFKVWWF